ncbi:META domain-containing protein [Leisingera daeponensis]|uniref:META domain-containing protein n=1 Tax=Leisingera daeponensis TaxID=405746 RepID=A0ABS7NHK8_9RHOB|nr:META domain-containing protein [Leisingera daeponensis]MBY6140630.1 META domain-containing protein [Leisingera daeponensis]
MLRAALITSLLLPTACTGDESLSAYGAAGKEWKLQSIDGAAFAAAATLTFPEPGKIAGRGPCNNFLGRQTAPYPWFETGPLAVTRMACPELEAEDAFLKALQEMTLAEVSGDVLILSNEAGREMLFKGGG